MIPAISSPDGGGSDRALVRIARGLALAVATVATVGAGAQVVFYSLTGRWVAVAVCGYLVMTGLGSGALLLLPPSVPWGVSAYPPGEAEDQGERDGEFDEFVV